MPPFITVWIHVGNRVVVAISVKVETVYRFGIKIFYAVCRNKSTDFRVVIPRFKEIQFGFGNGKFEEVWQFSSFFVCKGFKIIAVNKEETIAFGNIPKANTDKNNILLRACGKGQPVLSNGEISVQGKRYSPDAI